MIEIKGANQLADLAKALKDAGDKELQKELYSSINRALKPVKEQVRASARTNLPRRGGLAKDIAKSSLRVQRKTSMSGTAGIRVIAKNKYNLYSIDQGKVRHGKGNRTQPIRAGFWTKPTEALSDDVRREIIKAIEAVAKQVDRRTR